MQKNKYYIAYGSNLNLEQMDVRCPGAQIIGTSEIKDYRLLFKGSLTGSYLTIEKAKGYRVPIAIWAVSPAHERALDRYEGFPRFYYKKEFTLTVNGKKLSCFTYIMHENRPIGIPSRWYVEGCMEGYKAFHFPMKPLSEALKHSYNCCRKEVLR